MNDILSGSMSDKTMYKHLKVLESGEPYSNMITIKSFESEGYIKNVEKHYRNEKFTHYTAELTEKGYTTLYKLGALLI